MKTANGECRDLHSHGLHAMEQGHADSGIQWIPPRDWADLGAIAFRLPMLPDQEFTLIFPEWFAARETSWHAACRWSNPPETGVWEDGNGAATVRLRCMATGFGATLARECRFENRGARTLTDLAAFQCCNLDGAPLFKDLMMERTCHGCVHAAPLLGTLAPGAVASAKGRIVICRLP